jgi:uncharacterized protein (TIGR03083 family)
VDIELLRRQYHGLEELAVNLTSREWYAPAAVPGWSVIDVYSHLIGVELTLEGQPLPLSGRDVATLRRLAALEHVVNDRGLANEIWIESLSDLTPGDVLERFRRVTTSRLDTLSALSPDELDNPVRSRTGHSPDDGEQPVSLRQVLRTRLLDAWMHEQDIREGLGRPGHEHGPCPRAVLDEAVRLLAPALAARIDPAPGVTIAITLTGPLAGRIQLRATPDRPGSLIVVSDLSGAITEGAPDIDATTAISLPSRLFLRLIGGRNTSLSARLGVIEAAGDLDLADRVVTSLAVTT